MKIEFDPHLMQEVVLKKVEHRKNGNDSALFKEYHESANPIYEDYFGDERVMEFGKLYERFFKKLSFAESIVKALDEFPDLNGKIEGIVVGNAQSKLDERADLSNDLKSIGIKLLAKRFLEADYLQKLLRHELMHISDMLDEQYGYECWERLEIQPPVEQNIIRERYRILWDIYIDSRIIDSAKVTVSDKQGRYLEFETLYQRILDVTRAALFEHLWQIKKLTHHQILEMAKDTTILLQRFGLRSGVQDLSAAEPAEYYNELPGSLCPLCRFPTFNWKEEINCLNKDVITLIMEDKPGWKVKMGACQQCIDRYEIKAGQWWSNV